MFIFHEKCQFLGHVRMQNLPCNIPLFLVFLPHPDLLYRLKKENLRFKGMKSASGHLKNKNKKIKIKIKKRQKEERQKEKGTI